MNVGVLRSGIRAHPANFPLRGDLGISKPLKYDGFRRRFVRSAAGSNPVQHALLNFEILTLCFPCSIGTYPNIVIFYIKLIIVRVIEDSWLKIGDFAV
jgi:hypothetical protein